MARKTPKLSDAEKAANLARGLTPNGKLPKGSGAGIKKSQLPRTDNGHKALPEFPMNDYRCIGSTFTPARRNRYLAVVRRTGEKILARIDVGVSRTTVNNARTKDHQFRDAEDEALREHAAIYSQEMRRRGVEGVDKPVFGSIGGENGGTGIVGYVKEYSDRLLLEQARRFESAYTPKTKVEQTTVSAEALGLADLSPESQEDLQRILEREMARRAEAKGESEPA
jgi:hypothetical protein